MPEGIGDFFLRVLNATLFTVAGVPVTVASLGTGVLILIVTYVGVRGVDRALERAPTLKLFDGAHIGGIRRLVRYALYLIGGAVALETIGVNLSTLFAAGAIFAVGFGIAMQNIAQNFVSGVILLAERTVRQNDVLEVDGRVVRVVDMGIRATLARTRDDEEVIIPNASLVQNSVTNYTLSDALYRVRSRVGVSYGSDMQQVRQLLEATGRDTKWRSKRNEPRVLLLGFGDSTVDWELSVWIADPWDAPRALSRLNLAVWEALAKAGVTIAFPQLDLHLDEQVATAINRLVGSGMATPPTNGSAPTAPPA